MSGDSQGVEDPGPMPFQVPLSSILYMDTTADLGGHAVMRVDAGDVLLLFTACAHPAPSTADVEAARAFAHGAQLFAADVARMAEAVTS